MALQYSVCQMRDTGYSASANNSGGKKSCQITINQSYRVIVTDPADPDFTGADVTDLQVAFAPNIPLVNYNTYYDTYNGVGMPLAVCKSKSVKRDTSASNMFVVTCSFQTEPATSKNGKTQENPSDATQPAPEQPTDVGAVVSVSMGVREEVVYTAPAYAADESSLGTISTTTLPCDPNSVVADQWGPEFRIPVTKKIPSITFTITQFEDDWHYSNVLNRGYKVNNGTWGTDTVAKAYMITGINAVEQSVKVNSGGTLVDENWWRVTYTIERNDYSVSNYNSGTGQYDDLFVGHAAALPLYSDVYIDTAASPDVIRKFLTEENVPYIGKVDADGAKLASDGVNFVRYDTVDEISFGFLQWAPGDAI